MARGVRLGEQRTYFSSMLPVQLSCVCGVVGPQHVVLRGSATHTKGGRIRFVERLDDRARRSPTGVLVE